MTILTKNRPYIVVTLTINRYYVAAETEKQTEAQISVKVHDTTDQTINKVCSQQ